MSAILCVGGPKDGERVAISESRLNSGSFKVIDDRNRGAYSNEPWVAFTYEIARLRDPEGEYRVAIPAGGPGGILRQLINGYRPAKEVAST